MKKIFYTLMAVALATFTGCDKLPDDYPKPLTDLNGTQWVDQNDFNSTWGYHAYLSVHGDKAFCRTYDASDDLDFSGEGNVESINGNVITFSDFIPTTIWNISAVKIEKAEYSFVSDAIHRLTVYYREDVNEPFNPAEPHPEWIWSDVRTREFMLYDKDIHGDFYASLGM